MRAAIVCLGMLAACGGEKASGTGSGSATGSATATATGAGSASAAATAPPRPAAALPGYYRAADDTADLRYPALDDHWRATFAKTGGIPTVQLDYTDGDARARIQVVFPPALDAARTPAAIATELAQPALAAGLKPDGEKTVGNGHMIRLRGVPTGGTVEIVTSILAVVDDRAAALVVTTGQPAHLDRPGFKDGLAATIAQLRVGAQVPRLPSAAPGTPLDGVYVAVGPGYGQYEALVFDPRGYVHSHDELVADHATVHAALGSVNTYTADAKTVTLAVDGNQLTRTDATHLEDDGKKFCRVDQILKDPTLHGVWKAAIPGYTSANAYDTFSVYESTRYAFAGDGTFSFASTVDANLTNTRTAGPPIKAGGVDLLTGNPTEPPEVFAGTADSDHGTYRIERGRLLLQYANGAVVVKSIYGWCGSKPTGMLFIGGQLYLDDK